MDNFIDDSGKKRINPVAIKDGKAKIVTPAVQKVNSAGTLQITLECESKY